MKKTVVMIFIAITLASLPASAATFYVGSCHAGSFSTISAAVSSTSVPAGSIIKVCPGVYYEQVIVSKSLTLQGFPKGNAGSATITGSPADATVQTPEGFALRPSIWITAGTVNVTGMSVMQRYSLSDCSSVIGGIYYGSGTSGTVKNSNVSIVPSTPPGCTTSVGLWADNSGATADAVAVQNSTFEETSFGVGLVTQNPSGSPLSGAVSGNQVYGTAPLSAGIGFSGATGTISTNLIATGSTNIEAGANTTVTGNTTNGEVGVYLIGPAKLSKNTIRAQIAIDFNCNLATVSGNTITGGWGAQFTDAYWFAPTAFAGSNTFYNVGYVSTGSC